MTIASAQDTGGNGVDVQIRRVSPTRALTVAAHILKRLGPTPAMKLQKLVYYCQAWALVWDGKPLFAETIEARPNGPTVPELYEKLQGRFMVDVSNLPEPHPLDALELDTLTQVLKFYGGKSTQWLSMLTRQEDPWRLAHQARATTIDHAAMIKYYGEL